MQIQIQQLAFYELMEPKFKLYFKMVKTNHIQRRIQEINLSSIIFVGASQHDLSAYDIITGKIFMQLKKFGAKITFVAVNGFGDHIAILQNTSVIIIDIQSRNTLKLIGHYAEVQRIQFDPHSQFVATCSDDATARLWDVETGKQIQIYLGHKKEILDLHFNSDGDKLITCSYENAARFWDVKSGFCILVLDGHKTLYCVQNLITLGIIVQLVLGIGIFYNLQSTCKIWDVKTGKCIQTLTGHKDSILNLYFNIDGTRILTTSYDRLSRVQSVKTGEYVSPLMRCGNNVQYLVSKNLIISNLFSSPRIYSEAGELIQIFKEEEGRKIFCYSSKNVRVIVAVSQGDNAKFQIWKDIRN